MANDKDQIKNLLQLFDKDAATPVVEHKSSDLLQEDTRQDTSTKFVGKVYRDPETTEAKQVPGDQVRGKEGPGPFSHYKGKQHPFKGRLVGGESEEHDDGEALEEIDNGPKGNYREPGVTYAKHRNMTGTYVSQSDLAARRKAKEDERFWANYQKERAQREKARTNPTLIAKRLAQMGEPMVSDWYHGAVDDPYEGVRTGLIDMANDAGIHWNKNILDAVMRKWNLHPGMVKEDSYDVVEAQLKTAFEDYIAHKDSKKDKELQAKKEKKAKSDDKDDNQLKEGEEGASVEEISNAIMRRINTQFPTVIRQYGHEVVGNEIRDVAEFHRGAQELGTSDVSIMVKQVLNNLKRFNVEEGWGDAHGDEDEIQAERYQRKRDRDEAKADAPYPGEDTWPNPWEGTKEIPAVNEGDEHRRFYPGSKGVLAKQTRRLESILEDMKKLDAEGKLNPQMVHKFKSLLGKLELQAQSLPESTMNEAAEWSPSTPYGLRYRVFAGKEKRLTTVDRWYATSQAMQKAESKIRNSDNFYEIVGHHYPEVKEGAKEDKAIADRKKAIGALGIVDRKGNPSKDPFWKGINAADKKKVPAKKVSSKNENVIDASDRFKRKRAEDEADRMIRIGDEFWKRFDAAKSKTQRPEEKAKSAIRPAKEVEETIIPVGAPGKNIPVAGTSSVMPGQEDGAAPIPGQPVAPAQQAPAPKGLPTVPATPGQPVPPAAGQPGGAPVAQKAGSPAPASGSAANASTTPLETVKTAFTQLAQPGAQAAAQKVANALKTVK